MRFLKVVSFLFLLSMIGVFAGACTPDSPFTSCYQSVEDSGDDAVAQVKIQAGGITRYTDTQTNRFYYNEDQPIDFRCDGDKAYLYDFDFWVQKGGYALCDKNGCSSAFSSLPVRTNYEIDLTYALPIKPLLVCFDYDSERDGSWAWTAYNMYWDEKYYEIDRQCSSDSQCSSNQYCDILNNYESTCMDLVCDADEIIYNNQCIKPELPQFCADAGITEILACQEYAKEYIGLLQGDLNTKIDQISQLELTIDEKVQVITDLTSQIENLEEKREQQINIINRLNSTIQDNAQIIQGLNDTIQEQAIYIDELSATVDEQAEYISELTQNIDEQAVMINQLTQNLEEKAQLVSQLQAENELQAELILQMEQSFERQGQIITRLNTTVQEDAVIINSLSLKVEEQIQIINGMRKNIQEKLAIIEKLRQTNIELVEYVGELETNNAELEELLVELNQTQQYTETELGELRDKLEQKQQESQNVVLALAILLVVFISGLAYVFVRRR